MQPLWRLCKHFGELKCSLNLQRMVYPQERKNGESFQLIPTLGSDLEKANSICAQCKAGVFKLENDECPLCEKSDFEEVITGASIENENMVLSNVSFMECKNCHIRFIVFKRPSD